MRATVRPDWRGTGQWLAARLRVALPRSGTRAQWHSWRLLLLAPALALSALSAAADERIAVSRAGVEVRHGADPGAYVDAQFELQLPASLREAVDHGIALYFSVDVEVTRSRWYWFDKRVLDDTIEYRLSFSPLTREYRLARGGLTAATPTRGSAFGWTPPCCPSPSR
jgi:hypothetical protein